MHSFKINDTKFMSKQRSPYFYKNGADSYHWELNCKSNHYKSSNEEWNLSNTTPEKKHPCMHCLGKKEKTQQFWDRQARLKK